MLKWRNQQKFIKKKDTKIQNLQFPSKIEYDKSNDNPTLHKAAFELKLREGWRPKSKKKEVKEVPLTVIQALKQGVGECVKHLFNRRLTVI